MQDVKFCVDENGKWLGAHIGALPENTHDFVSSRPHDDRDIWDFNNQAWVFGKELIAEKLAEYAWQIEVAGITVNGMEIDTSDRSKLLINGMYNLAVQGDPNDTLQFKARNGSFTITNAQAIQIAVAVGLHVKRRIDAEAAVLAQIEAGSIITIEDAKAAFDVLMVA